MMEHKHKKTQKKPAEVFWRIFLTTTRSNADIVEHSCYRDAWKSTIYSMKTVSTDFSGNIYRKCLIFFPDLHLPDGMTTSPHPDHSTGPKPIQLVQVVFTIEHSTNMDNFFRKPP